MTNLPKTFLQILAVAVLSATACADTSNTGAVRKVDLATVVRDGFVEPIDGISAAGQPDTAAFRVFAEQGYTTVIDIRTESEDRGLDEAAVISDLGMEYVVFEIDKPEEINFENARVLDKLIANAEGPVLVHCKSSNRVGALLALRESLNGADDAAALRYGKEAGMSRLEGRVKEVLSGQ